ncbi:MAG: hypothetical protein JNL70_17510 [Saprospiraceae bacterium]|nr:hypothetical protein [Saprospiraceae bacterium]
MKKWLPILTIFLLTWSASNAQNNQKDEDVDDISQQMAKMQKQMMEQMKKLFGNDEEGDSTQMFNFSFKNMPFGQIDTSFTQSFGMMFDGKNWHSLSPNGDSTTDESFRQLRDRMPDFGKGFDMNMEDMFKSFSQMFQGGFPMSPNADDMPRIQPDNKKRKGEESKKNGKYKTESL